MLGDEADVFWMQRAFELAKFAATKNEVPVGAVLVLNQELIGEGWNQPIVNHDPTAHAEMIALRAGARAVGNYRLLNTTLYVTLEPCFMCAGAMVHARIKRLVYGANDAKSGVVMSKINALDAGFLNHRIEYSYGVMADQCGHLLSQFFAKKRI